MSIITIGSLWQLSGTPSIDNKDKLAHIGGYFAAFLPCCLAQYKHKSKIALGILLWSGAIEMIQPYVQREGELLDLVANAAGLSLAWVAGLFYQRYMLHQTQ